MVLVDAAYTHTFGDYHMTKAEELANHLTQNGALRWDTDRHSIVSLLEQYGQLVKEAAALELEKHGIAGTLGTEYDFANHIRLMDLP
jgi:hypothetical protein